MPPLGRRTRKPGAARLHRTVLTLAVGLVLGSFASTRPVSGQDREVALAVHPFHGTLSYGWATGADRFLGLEIGIGVPQLDRTLVPGDDALVDFAHLGVFLRTRVADSITFDRRIQLGLAGLDECSGCLPGVLGAVSGALFWGRRHVRAGPRLTAGVIAEMGNPAAVVVNLTPVVVLITYAW